MVDDLLALIDARTEPIGALDRQLLATARGDPRVKARTQLPGVGILTALMSTAEVGDITRFPSARTLTAWAGLTPTVRGCDLTVRHGHLCQQGSAWLRWILCEAAQTAQRPPRPPTPTSTPPGAGARRSPPPRWPAGSWPVPAIGCGRSTPAGTGRCDKDQTATARAAVHDPRVRSYRSPETAPPRSMTSRSSPGPRTTVMASARRPDAMGVPPAGGWGRVLVRPLRRPACRGCQRPLPQRP